MYVEIHGRASVRQGGTLKSIQKIDRYSNKRIFFRSFGVLYIFEGTQFTMRGVAYKIKYTTERRTKTILLAMQKYNFSTYTLYQ